MAQPRERAGGHVPVTTATIGRFFEEVSGVPPDEFLAISDRYGYWNATPEENAEVGITVPAPAHP